MKDLPSRLIRWPGLALLVAASILALLGYAPAMLAQPKLGPGSYEIRMVSRRFTPSPGIAGGDQRALEAKGRLARAGGKDRIHALVQLDELPSQAQKHALARGGLVLLEYVPNYAWLAAIPAGDPGRVNRLPGVRWVGSLTAADKRAPSLTPADSPWAFDVSTNQAALYVMMHRDVTPEVSAALLANYGEVKSYASAADLYVVVADADRLEALLGEDGVAWVQPAEPKWEVDNGVARLRVDSDDLDGAGYGDADGTNVDILIYDGGWALATHRELVGRVTQRTSGSCSVSYHATHVACTTSAYGVATAAIGMANDMHAILSDCLEGTTGVFLYTDPGDVQENLTYAKDTWIPAEGDGDGAELWNASLGTNTAPNGWPCVWEGNYGPTDVIVDNMVRGDTASSGKFIGVWANGNERGYGCGNTYHTTAPPACGKNAIHVGASNKDADTMTSFSSWGPCDDGRIKPTITAPGCAVSGGIYSCDDSKNNKSYVYLCGTSMAAPVTSGVVAQLIEYCRAQGLSYCPIAGEFWPSSAKALLMHGAVDLGNAGPDYQWGYGRIDADASADLLTNSAPNYADLRQSQIANPGEIDTFQISVTGSPAQLKVSLAWDDEAATMQALTKLVNDLDLEVVSPGGTTYYPYVLDPSNPANAATTGPDRLNNQEQVVVSSPASGTWTIRVIGAIVPAGPQDYSIIFPNAYNTAPSETPGATPAPTPTPNPSYCAELVTNGTFEATGSWTISGSAARSTTYAHGGSYSMVAGGTADADGTFYQDVTLPEDAYCGTISFWYRMETSETSHPWDFFDVEVRDATSGATLTTLLSTDDSKANGAWTEASFPIGPDYRGRALRLHFSANVDDVVSTYWYVDDVSFDSCTWAPTAATLGRFEAFHRGDSVIVEWETTEEINTAGFLLYRQDSANGEKVQVTGRIVPALLDTTAGGTYRVLDPGARPGRTYAYTLQEIENRGQSRHYGPFEVTATQPFTGDAFPSIGWAGYHRIPHPATVAKKPKGPEPNTRTDGPRALPETPERQLHPEWRASQDATAAADTDTERVVGAVTPTSGVAKLSVHTSGLYYLAAEDIADALGLNMGQVRGVIRTTGLKLSNHDQMVGYVPASGNAGLYFYAQGLESPYAADNVYWLQQDKGRPFDTRSDKAPAAVPLSTFATTSRVEQDLLPVLGLFNDPAADYWMWDYVVAGDPSLGRRSFDLRADGAARQGSATITARFLGVTASGAGADHHAQIMLNGSAVGHASWAGAVPHEVTLSVDPSLLNDGTNTVEVLGVLDEGVPYSIFFIDSFDFSYQRFYRASGDALAFPSPDDQAATVYGFTDRNVMVFDISNPLQPVQVIRTKIEAWDGAYRVTFRPAAAGQPHLAVTTAVVPRITSLAADTPSSLTEHNGADYVIITTAGLAQPAAALAAYRQDQGLEAQVVDVQDIYDEFNGGVASPDAIHAFLAYAYANWSPAPHYVLLAGAGSYDYKNILGYGDSLVPPILVGTLDILRPADGRYADLVGDDGAPEIAVGRLPVLTQSEFEAYLTKIQGYEAGDAAGWSRQLLLLADNRDPEAGDFPADSDVLAADLPAGYTAQRVYLGPLSRAEARSQTLTALRNGVGLFNFIGHGGLDTLAAENLLTRTDVPSLQNSPRLAFMSAATCAVGDYGLPGYRSLGVLLALQGDGGATAVFAPTGSSLNADGVALVQDLFEHLFADESSRLGDATRAALTQLESDGGPRYALDTYNLLGDPAMEMRWR